LCFLFKKALPLRRYLIRREMDNTGHTFESVWATFESVGAKLDRVAAQQAETDRILRESRTETERVLTEKLADLTEQQAETDRILKEKSAALDRQIEKVSKQIEKTDKMMGGMSNNNGLFAEEYFFNSIKKDGKTLFGEKFDRLIKAEIMEDENNKTKGELDTLLINGTSAAIIEVKFRVREKSIEKVKQKVKRFRERFPEYRNHRLYLGLASLVFDEAVEEDCRLNGIAVIKQVGDKVVVYDENLKTF
jgi:hypothetical protein